MCRGGLPAARDGGCGELQASAHRFQALLTVRAALSCPSWPGQVNVGAMRRTVLGGQRCLYDGSDC